MTFVPGSVNLKRVELKDLKNKTSLDLKDIMVELDIFEDLFSGSMSAAITIFDTNNLITEFPIVGEELIEIEFETDKMETIKKRFYIYKLSNRIQEQDHKMAYILHLVSYEAIIDLNTKISRAFSGFTHDIAKNIFEKYIVSDQLYDKKPLILENSTNEIKFVSPYWSPFRCISYAASKSTVANNWKSPAFLFYESNKAFRFVSIESLVKEKPIVDYIFDSASLRESTPQGGSQVDQERQMRQVISLKIDQHFDYIQKVMSGVITHQTFEHDMIFKQIKRWRYDYQEDFSKSAHLHDNKTNSDNLLFTEKNAVVDTRTNFSFAFDEKIKDISAEISHKRNSLLPQLDMFKVTITVLGNSRIEVGDIVNLQLGRSSALNSSELVQLNIDKYYSGKYMITAIQHRLTNSRHEMIMELMKDSLVEALK